jgi:hypothetical protein
MATIDITIPAPVLVSGQFFRVEYSTDGVSYTLWSNTITNTLFTVTGLTEGTLYYFRFTLLLGTSPVTECDPVVRTYFIPATEPCVEVTGEITRAGDIWELVLTFVLASPYVAPCGGYRLEYGISPNFTSLYFPTFLASPAINPMTLPASNGVYTVKIYTIDCEGNEVLCNEITVNPPGGCTHATIHNDTRMIKINGKYYLYIYVNPSVPASTFYSISYQQANSVMSGVNDPGGTVVVYPSGGSPELFIISVIPNVTIIGDTISYIGTVTDNCNYSSAFDESVTI